MKYNPCRLKQFIQMGFITGLIVSGLFSACLYPGSKPLYFGITIVDEATGKGIPMVELKMTNALTFHSDNLGNIAFYEPELMGQELYFLISSPGYDYRKDVTGRQSVTLNAISGQDTLVKLRRTNIAERLYRITGAGRYVHSQRLKYPVPERSGLISGVLGQDSNLGAIYKGRYFWVWGDTFLPNAYHGNFSVSAALSSFPENGGISPEKGLELEYFTDDRGWTKPMINLNAPGYVWFDWLMTLPDRDGELRLAAKYARVNAYFGNYERGIAVFNDEREVFEKSHEVNAWINAAHKCDHPFKGWVGKDSFYYLTSEFHFSRVTPTLDHVSNPLDYDHFTCLKEGESIQNDRPKIDRNAKGQIQYSWKRGTGAIDYAAQTELIKRGVITKEEGYLQPTDLISGQPVDVKRGSISWNPFRQRWILIAGATDIWYSEADTPVGPWVYVQKVVSNDQFLYNPVHHAFLDQEDGKRVFFQGTFTKFFSKEPPIPRYDYNQLMYGLNLSNHRLKIPVPVYALSAGESIEYGLRPQAINASNTIDHIPFFALDQKVEDAAIIPIYQNTKGATRLVTEGMVGQSPLFHAIHQHLDRNLLFQGDWEVKINFKSFDNFLNIKLIPDNQDWKVTCSKKSFEISAVKIVDGHLSLAIEHEGDTYFLNGEIQAGVLEGTFTHKGHDYKGTWHARKRQETWWAPFSPVVKPLFEYQNVQNNTFYYSTEKVAFSGAWVRSANPLCYVWDNPTQVITYDFSTNPIAYDKRNH